MEEALEKHMPDGTSWTHPEGGMTLWVTLPSGFDAGELLIHARERGILFLPGRYFYSQQPRPNTLRLGFAAVDEKRIVQGIEKLAGVVESELRKRQRGVRDEFRSRVALI
jgi:2-aminoadipate transaminase